jgi:hypothetical protein
MLVGSWRLAGCRCEASRPHANGAMPTWYEHPYDGRNTRWPLRDGGGDALELALPNSDSIAEFKVRGADYRDVRLCMILHCPGHDIASLTPQIAMHTSVVRVRMCAHTAPTLKLTSQHTCDTHHTLAPSPHTHTHTHIHTHTHTRAHTCTHPLCNHLVCAYRFEDYVGSLSTHGAHGSREATLAAVS